MMLFVDAYILSTCFTPFTDCSFLIRELRRAVSSIWMVRLPEKRPSCESMLMERMTIFSSLEMMFVMFDTMPMSSLAELIHKYVPDCRVAIGHGQMSPEELEKIIMGFINYEYDVLLSTTIVENGVNIPNANTIIINDAHHFGLSDLHQMRGRVGRSNRKAFCYLLAPATSSAPSRAGLWKT